MIGPPLTKLHMCKKQAIADTYVSNNMTQKHESCQCVYLPIERELAVKCSDCSALG